MISGTDWIFIRNPKCATTSIVRALEADGSHVKKGSAHGNITLYPMRANRIVSVRNPFDRIVSAWNHLGPDQSFGDWLTGSPHEVAPGIDIKRVSQMYWLHGANIVLRFERIEDDFSELARRIRIDAKLPSLNARPHGHYREHFTPRLKEIVEDRFAYELERFGYAF